MCKKVKYFFFDVIKIQKVKSPQRPYKKFQIPILIHLNSIKILFDAFKLIEIESSSITLQFNRDGFISSHQEIFSSENLFKIILRNSHVWSIELSFIHMSKIFWGIFKTQKKAKEKFLKNLKDDHQKRNGHQYLMIIAWNTFRI